MWKALFVVYATYCVSENVLRERKRIATESRAAHIKEEI